jgi:hypothetical protein
MACELGILKPNRKVALTIVMSSTKLTGGFPMHTVVGSSTYDPELSNNSRNERDYIEPAPPPPPKNPIACPSQATATAAC